MKNMNSEQVSEVVRNSKSIAECLRGFGLIGSGGNYRTFYKLKSKFGFDTSHFLGQAHGFGKKRDSLPKIPIEEVLVKESSYSPKTLKSRLIQSGLLEEKCKICGLGSEWNSKRLVLVLDHINGINNDNRLENLRLLCPNCNSQQSTFCGRNRGIQKVKNLCVDCGKPIHHRAVRCLEHSRLFGRKVINRPSFEKLSSEIESYGYSAVGRCYGVSGRTVKKWLLQEKREADALSIKALGSSPNIPTIFLFAQQNKAIRLYDKPWKA